MDEWLALFTRDARYVVPTADLPDGNPDRDVVFINDDSIRLRARVERLNRKHAHIERPRSRTRRFIGNVRVTKIEEKNIVVAAAFMVWRFRYEQRALYVGKYDYVLKTQGDILKIHRKKVVLDNESLSEHGTIGIIL
uniref:p-cumate 2,3-dioxygenase beta subunit n=1 Tax=Candidatus Kentrum sp. LPFa TaxID=2126335 RepID=A0A450VYR3_9GAMM|nr:MAG: p-cumate 2,3-dioxygenase beta subunit [Candidatus Kentron sp. LPFa]VFK26156.1 MAG: p-cumate 2,3-dioxygenase beta subunit [Candidatus Kentron sp. LPFa]